MRYSYPNVLEASRAMLLDVCERLSELRSKYVIVGGWVPFLRTKHESLRHPGTKDVDVLLNDDAVSAKAAVEALMKADYLPSAKHPFQLLHVLKIEDQEMVFNADLMHPAESSTAPEMFADILELHIRENYDPKKVKMKSIAFPSSLIVFEQTLWSDFLFKATRPSGVVSEIAVPLLDEVGLVLSKCDSVRHEKRRRDAFDIYFVLTGSNGDDVGLRLRRLGRTFPQVQQQLDLLRAYLGNAKNSFDRNVSLFAPNLGNVSPPPSNYVWRKLFND
jgi:hypothetical protein